MGINQDTFMAKFFSQYKNSIFAIPEDRLSASFELCSKRLRNALYRSHIFKVQDLLSLNDAQLLSIPGLGEKGVEELCNFLMSLSNDPPEQPQVDFSVFSKASQGGQESKPVPNNKPVVVDFENMRLEFDGISEKYHLLFMELIDHISDLTETKITDRERSIFLYRLGIHGQAKSLQDIGDIYSISRERVRQILNKAVRKIQKKPINTDKELKLEHYREQIASNIENISASNFLSFLFLQGANIELVEFVCKYYLRNNINTKKFKRVLVKKINEKNQSSEDLKKAHIYNNHINQLIIFPNKSRLVTDKDFSRLKTERTVHSEEELSSFAFNGEIYQCESFLEQRVLRKLLMCRTFKSIKTQSLKIPYKNRSYYPDFQCLTHDNRLVLIEIKPLYNMCEHKNIQKFEALRLYCEKYGFGYIIMDDRENSYEHIDEHNEEFTNLLLSEIHQNGYLRYKVYKKIHVETNASVKNLLTLIKKQKLTFSSPFFIKQ